MQIKQQSRRFADECVRDAESLIVSDPTSVTIGSNVFSAVEAILEDPRTQTVYIVDEDGVLKGLIGIIDLLKVSAIQVGAHKQKRLIHFFKYLSLLYSETVDEIMRKPLSVKMDDKLMKALQIMEEHNLTDLPVVDDKNRLVGEISGLEILTVLKDKIKAGEI